MLNASNSWDPHWEKVYKSQEWGKYPPEELVRFIARNFYAKRKSHQIRVLDLGCGTGSACWFLSREKLIPYGIDGSPTAIQKAKKRFTEENLKGEFKVGDFIELDYPARFFDCVIDIDSLQHNKPEEISKALKEVIRVLKPGGVIFSMMLSSRSKFSASSPCDGKGYYKLFNENEVKKIFKDFLQLQIERSERTDKGNTISHHIISGKK